MSARFRTLAFFAAMVVLASCALHEQTREERRTQDSTEGPRRAPLLYYEASFNPADYDETIEEAQKPRQQERRPRTTESDQDSVMVETEVLQGFRIQIFATPNIDEANAMRITAAQRITEDSVYVVFDPPVYKVRLGDFRTRADANQRLGMLVQQGFPDAWVVSDRIIIRKFLPSHSLEPERPEN